MKLAFLPLLSVLPIVVGCSVNPETSLPDHAIRSENVMNHVGMEIQVCGQVTSTEFAPELKNKPTFINMGEQSTDHHFAIAIPDDARQELGYAPEVLLDQMKVCVTGEVELNDGKPQVVVNHPRQILISELQTPESVERVYGPSP
jgi:hypothetical protein